MECLVTLARQIVLEVIEVEARVRDRERLGDEKVDTQVRKYT